MGVERQIPELKTQCMICAGTGKTEHIGFSSAGDMDAGNDPHPVTRTCYQCKGRGWAWALDQQEMAERIADLAAEVERLKEKHA